MFHLCTEIAVVHKDSEAFFQWCTYWFILHLYSTVLSPIFHFTLHPIFQLIAILWLSLPRFQGASFVYERVVVPWVKKYENQVDEVIDDAHRGIQRWIWSKMGYTMALVVGESGNLIENVFELIFGKPLVRKDSDESKPSEQQQTAAMDIDHLQSFSTSKHCQQPRHSVRDALRHSSTLEEFVAVDGEGNVEHSIEFMTEYVSDFKAMLQHGLYVFANIEMSNTTTNVSVGQNSEFRLGVLSYHVDKTGDAFLISPVGTEANSSIVRFPLYGLSGPICTGSQGIILEWTGRVSMKDKNRVKAEVVLSNQEDRDILFKCLTNCLPWMRA